MGESIRSRIVRSFWLVVIAAVPVVYLSYAALAGYVLVGPGSLSDVSSQMVAVAIIPGFLAPLALPLAIYQDIGSLTDWEPDRTTYTIASAAGIFVPLVSLAVSSYYLYRRLQIGG